MRINKYILLILGMASKSPVRYKLGRTGRCTPGVSPLTGIILRWFYEATLTFFCQLTLQSSRILSLCTFWTSLPAYKADGDPLFFSKHLSQAFFYPVLRCQVTKLRLTTGKPHASINFMLVLFLPLSPSAPRLWNHCLCNATSRLIGVGLVCIPVFSLSSSFSTHSCVRSAGKQEDPEEEQVHAGGETFNEQKTCWSLFI